MMQDAPNIAAPTISILLSTFDDGDVLPVMLDCIASQSRPADEILLLDDGSRDNTPEILEEFVRRHANVRIFRHERNRGLLPSIRFLLDQVKTDYFCWLASDDQIFPDFLKDSADRLAAYPSAGLVCSELTTLDFEQRLGNVSVLQAPRFGLLGLPAFLSGEEFAWWSMHRFVLVSSNTVVARTESVRRAGGFLRDLAWHADWFTFLVVALRDGICPLPAPLTVYCASATGYSAAGMGNASAQDKIMRALAKRLLSPPYKDVGAACMKAPELLSVFGDAPLRAWRTQIRAWKLWHAYAKWRVNHALPGLPALGTMRNAWLR